MSLPSAIGLRRRRPALERGVARELAAALGEEQAGAEAASLLDALLRAAVRGAPASFLRVIRERSRRWKSKGADGGAVGRAMLSLVVPAAGLAPSRNGARFWTTFSQRMGPVLNSVPVPLLVIDREHRVRSWNSALAMHLAKAPEGLRDRALPDLLDPGCREWVDRQLRAGHPAGAMVRFGNLRLTARPEITLLASGVPFEQEGELKGWYLALTLEPERVFEDPTIGDLLRREKSQKDKFAALLTVSHAVANSLDLSTILGTIAHQVRQVIHTDECTVFLYDESTQMLKPEACEIEHYRDEMMSVRLKLGEGITGSVALSGCGEIVNDAERDPRAVRVPNTPEEHSSLLCVPLLSREKVVGVITLTRTAGRSFVGEDLELATIFAGHCSAAIANARLYEETRAAYDELRETQSQLVQSAKLNALGEMAGGVAHDFNNILAAILGRTQLLMQSVDDPEVRRQLQVIEQAALDGAHTVRRVQEFTRVRHDERFATLDLSEVLREVVELTRPAWEANAKRNGVTIEVELELAARQTIAGNGSELREVFTNLVLNAVDAMPWGGAIQISTNDVDGEVVVRIRDSGVGMDDETRLKIFDPFFTTKAAKGTGLGLSVAYGIVSRHHGSISVESELHLGTEFTLRFPAGQTLAPPVAETVPGPVPKLRILVVDDEEPVLNVIADLLRTLGQEVEVALGGPAGLARFERDRFDVVFTDLGMPEVNGWDLALAVKSRRPGVAVVVVTGWGFQLEDVTARAHGVDLVVPKPFSVEDLERALRHIGENVATGGRA